MVTDKNDILIMLEEELKATRRSEIVVQYVEFDTRLGFQCGSTKTFLKSAAAEVGYEVIVEGETVAKLKSSYDPSEHRIQRG